MKSGKKVLLAVCCSLLLLAAVSAAVADPPLYERLGRLLSRGESDPAGGIAAAYGTFQVTYEQIEYAREVDALRVDGAEESDLEVAQRLITGQLLLEEARALGLEATDEEVAAMVGDIRSNYETVPEVRSILDEYCSGANITIEAYFQRIEAEAPATLTRQKLKNHILGSYAETHPDASSEELEAAYQAYREALYAEHEDEITLYIAH